MKLNDEIEDTEQVILGRRENEELTEIVRQQDLVLEDMKKRSEEIKVLVDDTTNDIIDHLSKLPGRTYGLYSHSKGCNGNQKSGIGTYARAKEVKRERSSIP